MKINVYDFDKTIYNGDSTAHFYLYCLKKHPQIALLLPIQGFFFIFFALKIMPKTKFKEKFYIFFRFIKNIEEEVEKFWDLKSDGIKKWYIKIQREDDLIISASPEFLLTPICKRLKITGLMASRVDPKTGKYTGLNCYGEEKVKRLKEKMPSVEINEFYSDSYSDQPLASLAKKSFMVVGDSLYDWNDYKNK